MAIKRGSKVNSGYSAASMTDLMFLLLLFLLISTTLINPNAIKVLLPKGNNQAKDKAFTTVVVTSDDNYYIETTPVMYDNLESALQARLDGAENPTVSLHGDEKASYGAIYNAFKIIERNNYTLILASRPE